MTMPPRTRVRFRFVAVAVFVALVACQRLSKPGDLAGGGTSQQGPMDAASPTDAGKMMDADPSADASPSPGSPVEIPGWTLIFQDEFDGPGPALDPSKHWSVYAGPQGNAPQVSHFEPEQTYVENGLLRLKIEHKTVQGDPYACGGLENAMGQAQTFGRWVVRARLPQGKGNVGYVGLFGSGSTEIDFSEGTGMLPHQNVFTQHGANGEKDAHAWTGGDATTDFHEYTLDWEPGTLIWLVDGVEQYRTTQHFTNESLILAIGDWVSSCDLTWFGCPDSAVTYPAYMDIDYVRIYKKN